MNVLKPKRRAAPSLHLPSSRHLRRRGARASLKCSCPGSTFPDDEDEPVSWSAEWGLRDDSVGTEDSNEDMHQLIRDIIEDARL